MMLFFKEEKTYRYLIRILRSPKLLVKMTKRKDKSRLTLLVVVQATSSRSAATMPVTV